LVAPVRAGLFLGDVGDVGELPVAVERWAPTTSRALDPGRVGPPPWVLAWLTIISSWAWSPCSRGTPTAGTVVRMTAFSCPA
jgi:hypothetical protein